jgi:hypothetical protein
VSPIKGNLPFPTTYCIPEDYEEFPLTTEDDEDFSFSSSWKNRNSSI